MSDLTLEGHAMKEAIRQKEEPHLRAVETGEVPAGPQTLAEALPEIENLKRELDAREMLIGEKDRKYNGALSQIGLLKADKAREAREHKLWPRAFVLFNEWRIICDHMGSKWTEDRFWAVQPYLTKYGFHACRMAIYGLAADHFQKQITPKYTKRYDEFWRAFKNADAFESYVNIGTAVFGKDLPLPEQA